MEKDIYKNRTVYCPECGNKAVLMKNGLGTFICCEKCNIRFRIENWGVWSKPIELEI